MKKPILTIALAVGMALPLANIEMASAGSGLPYETFINHKVQSNPNRVIPIWRYKGSRDAYYSWRAQNRHAYNGGQLYFTCNLDYRPNSPYYVQVKKIEGPWAHVRVVRPAEIGCLGWTETRFLAQQPQEDGFKSGEVAMIGRWADNEITKGQKRRINQPITLYRDYENHDGPARNRDCDLRSGTVSVVSGTVRNGMVQLNVPEGECDNTWVVVEGLKSNTSAIGSVDEVPVFKTRGAFYSARPSMDREGHYNGQRNQVACKLEVGAKVEFKPFRDWGVGEVRSGNCSGWIDRGVIR